MRIVSVVLVFAVAAVNGEVAVHAWLSLFILIGLPSTAEPNSLNGNSRGQRFPCSNGKPILIVCL